MATLTDLAKQLNAYATKLDEKASQIAVQAATAILKDLLRVTPVDTSQAVSNWQIGLGEPPGNRLPPYYSGAAGSTADKSAAAALRAGLKTLQSKKAGVTIFISNSLPYIQRLNDGYSKQAPAGFVERSVAIGRKITENIKIT